MNNVMHPIFECQLPFTKKKLKFRPLTIRDEKCLLMVDGNDTTKINALKRVVKNCLVDPENLSFDDLPFVDFQYAFLFLRSISVDNKIEITVNKNDKVYNTMIDINDVKYRHFESFSKNKKICFSKTSGVIFNLPKVKHFEVFQKQDQTILDLIAHCVESFYEDEKVLDSSNTDEKQLIEMFEDIPSKHLKTITALFTDLPTLYFDAEINVDGKKEVVEISEFSDFF